MARGRKLCSLPLQHQDTDDRAVFEQNSSPDFNFLFISFLCILSLPSLLSPICCYVYPPDVFLCLLFFFCMLSSFTPKVTPLPLPRVLLFPVLWVLNFAQGAAIQGIAPTAETFEACRKEPNFQLLLKPPCSVINRTNEARFPVVSALTRSLR